MDPLADLAPLTPPCPEGTLVICATARLAQDIRRAHGQVQMAQGLQRWATPDCQTLDQWLGRLAEAWSLRGQADGQGRPPLWALPVLDAHAQRLLWEAVIRSDLGPQAASLFDVAALARHAADAHELATVWEADRSAFGDPSVADEALTEETRRWRLWQQRVVQRCATLGVVDAPRALHAGIAECEARLAPSPVSDGGAGTAWPRRVAWAGFHRFSPLETRLMRALHGAGIEQRRWHDRPMAAAAPRVRGLPDTRGECLAAAAWAAEALRQQPLARLAIVTPDLAGVRLPLQDALEDALDPRLARPALASAPRPYNISLGTPLAAQPLVALALELLDIQARRAPVDLARWSALLRSPLWSSPDEADARARLDALMRRECAATLTPDAWLQWLRRSASERGLAVSTLLAHAKALLAPGDAPGPPSDWAARWPEALGALGWLHARSLSSQEYQTREAFFEAMRRLAACDALLGSLNAQAAVRRLRQLCRERLFQPQTEGQPPVQVLGALEAGGLRFDGVWVMGLGSEQWPPRARPNGLLPADAQRRTQCPNASAEVQLALATRVLDDLLQAAPEVTLSWPHSVDGTAHAPSALLRPWLAADAATAAPEQAPEPPGWLAEAARAQGQALDRPLSDSEAPPVSSAERLRGGTGLLRAQAICPAWAFYRYRLGAQPLDPVQDGLDASERGTLLHGCLRQLWTELRDSSSLARLSADDEQALIARAVEAALEDFARQHDAGTLPDTLRALEASRLQRLMRHWLALERTRSAAFQVLATEQSRPVTLGALALTVSIDRIDQLDDGRCLVIDYKSGADTDRRNWSTARLTEPQLPLYAAFGLPEGPEVAGLAFARVRTDAARWQGIAADEGLLPGVHALHHGQTRRQFDAERFPDWAALLGHWRQALRRLADELLAGQAAVRPTREADLAYSGVLPLLRLAERRAQWDALARAAATVAAGDTA